MTRRPATGIGLEPDELLASTWAGGPPLSYALQGPDLNVLRGETVALVGPGASALLGHLSDRLAGFLPVDGAVAASGGTLRIHAQQAARVGVEVLVIDEPLPVTLPGAARTLAIADLAGLGALGLTTLVATADSANAALFADRVVVANPGQPAVGYPVLARAPRTAADVRTVVTRVRRLADTA